MRILGISAFYHDSAAALIEDGDIVAAAQEERFTRKKHDPGFPRHAIDFVLREGGTGLQDVDYVVFYEKPFLKFERLLETYLAFAPKGFASFAKAMPVWLREKLFQKNLLKDDLRPFLGDFGQKGFGQKDFDQKDFDWDKRLLFTEHHVSHAASAFYPSPFGEAAVLTLDGVGEWATTTAGIGQGRKLEITREIHFPHSLGLLYSALTYHLGFKVNSGEYKIMGLAAYGEPKYAQLMLDKLIDIKPDGSFRLDLGYFDYCTGLRMTNSAFDDLMGGPPRGPETPLTQRHMDLAASVQAVTEEVMLRMTRALAAETGMKNLCLAGGVALNCVANGKVLRDGAFERIWIQPAAGDAGGALGAALAAYHLHCGQDRIVQSGDAMHGAYLGPAFSQKDCEAELSALDAKFDALDDDALIGRVADALAAGKAVGWFQGRMEFGPRALGNRSILGDPRAPDMQKTLNLKVKFRESFRPFAPSVLREDLVDWFTMDSDSPYMLLVADVVPERCRTMSDAEKDLFGIDKLNIVRSEIPAVTHVDYSARVQTVHRETNPRYHALITAFKERTGCPVLVNTSFNVRGEPIVCTPTDAYRCFMGTGIDMLVIGNCVLEKAQQDSAAQIRYEAAFELD
jgi:carbamoyltransferase